MDKAKQVDLAWSAAKRPSVPLTVGRGVDVYSMGIVHCSICVPKRVPIGTAIELVNAEYPTGINSVWHLSADKTFACGKPNPCPCSDSPESRTHYLLVC